MFRSSDSVHAWLCNWQDSGEKNKWTQQKKIKRKVLRLKVLGKIISENDQFQDEEIFGPNDDNLPYSSNNQTQLSKSSHLFVGGSLVEKQENNIRFYVLTDTFRQILIDSY